VGIEIVFLCVFLEFGGLVGGKIGVVFWRTKSFFAPIMFPKRVLHQEYGSHVDDGIEPPSGNEDLSQKNVTCCGTHG